MLSVGQKLWMVPSDRRAGGARFVSITKVGRKWADISIRGYRIDKETLWIDGGDYTSPGRCYLTKDEHDAKENLNRAWRKLRDFVDRKYTAPDGVTTDGIEAALSALGATASKLSD